MTTRNYLFRLYPTKAQERELEGQFETHRRLYNWALGQRKDAWEKEGLSVKKGDQWKEMAIYRRDHPYLSRCYQNACQATIQRVDLAYQAFFRRVKNGENPGYPRFKKRGEWTSITYPTYGAGCVIRGNKLEVFAGKGNTLRIKMRMDRPLPFGYQVATSSLVKKTDGWYVMYCCKVPLPQVEVEPDRPDVGVDVGVLNLLSTTQGSPVPNFRIGRATEEKKAVLQARMARCKKRSNQWHYLRKRVARVDLANANRRQHWQHEKSREMTKSYSLIAHEDLRIQNMVRRPAPRPDEANPGNFLPNGASSKSGLNKSILDASWGRLFQMLAYKAEETKTVVVAVPPHYTSQTCSGCGEPARVKLELSNRTYHCHACGCQMDRDVNAAHNILNRAREMVRQKEGIELLVAA